MLGLGEQIVKKDQIFIFHFFFVFSQTTFCTRSSLNNSAGNYVIRLYLLRDLTLICFLSSELILNATSQYDLCIRADQIIILQN